ncbi:hypothetical protein JJL56_01155 [Azospirillum sp. YIM DDC1]|uniref:SLATT domain-containing protein n=1 Tax=Azospirillum aestuarii TaxID=2802052 RepID=A0ABS1HRM3_9PROT|nr:hypothetical protein [Azospirillum aestuarii]MBK4717468.1 hypothetical protein [Azospirillum aestuarii]
MTSTHSSTNLVDDVAEARKKIISMKEKYDNASNASFFCISYLSLSLTIISAFLIFTQDIIFGDQSSLIGMTIAVCGFIAAFISYGTKTKSFEDKARDLYWYDRDLFELEQGIILGRIANPDAAFSELNSKYYDCHSMLSGGYRLTAYIWGVRFSGFYFIMCTVFIVLGIMIRKGVIPPIF